MRGMKFSIGDREKFPGYPQERSDYPERKQEYLVEYRSGCGSRQPELFF